jgi:outer membrane receptor protein involved in Fe transport
VVVELPRRDSFAIVNAGKASAYGGELELSWELSDDLELWLASGVLRTRYDDFLAILPGGTTDLAGREFPGAPRLTISSGLRWRATERWEFGANHWFSGEAYSDPLNSPEGLRSAYGILDLSARRQLSSNMQMHLTLTNALDRRYLENVRVAGSANRVREYVPGRERRLELGFDWRW